MANDDMIFGMSMIQLIDVHRKLQVIGIDLGDIEKFLDRDKVQLFAEQERTIKLLKCRLANIQSAALQISEIASGK